jgi:hypothetical protein
MEFLNSFFSGSLLWVFLKWVILLALWLVFAFGIYRQHTLFKRIAKKQSVQEEIIILFKMLHERQLQLWILVTLLMVVIVVNELHPEGAAFPPVLAVASEPLQVAAAAPAKKAPDPFEIALAKNKANSALPFSEITEFNEKNSSEEAYIDLLKRRYETWLVTYYYLQKCGKAEPSDLIAIRASLRRELDAAHGAVTDEDNILLAANGSYTEMYRDIPCDAPHIGPTKASYDTNMQQLHAKGAPSPATSLPSTSAASAAHAQ